MKSTRFVSGQGANPCDTRWYREWVAPLFWRKSCGFMRSRLRDGALVSRHRSDVAGCAPPEARSATGVGPLKAGFGRWDGAMRSVGWAGNEGKTPGSATLVSRH